MITPLLDRVIAAIGHQYQLDGEIGRGGMSVVYRARDLRLDRPVAIKVLPPEMAYDPSIRMRFTREAQTSAQLAHGGIVPIHDVGEREGIAYFVMALVNGGNLGALLAREPRQPIEEVRRVLAEIADALEYAHVRGVIHRDVKPDNILLDENIGRAMITDFGIARAIEAGTRLTVTGNAVGTPTYMSPEQAKGDRDVDGRSDLYSLGVIGYQMLTGRVPFTAGNTMALLLKHVSERVRPVADFRPDAPRALRETVERALAKAPEDRWPSAGAFRDALLSGEGPGTSWRTPQREPVRYVSPRRGSPAAPVRESTPAAPPRPGVVAHVPDHLTQLTSEQRKDLRLWHGRVHLLDRIKTMRRYTLLTAGMWVAAMIGVAVGAEEELPPLIFSPIVPIWMSAKLGRRGRSLRESGLKLRRVLFMLRPKWALPPIPETTEQKLEKLAPREVLDSSHGDAIRRAAKERSEILDLVASLSKADRELLPDLEPTVHALVERVAHLAMSVCRLEEDMDPAMMDELEAQIAEESEGESPEGERRLALLKRQQGTLEELARRRDALIRQLENANLALGNLRFDLIKLRSSGLESALADVSTATQQARALSRELGAVLDAAEEVRRL
ncbi:MAG: serine/threonine-protein kinase [Gemmatimonadales bacterium]